MKLIVRAVGKMRDRRLEDLCREYLDRARRHLPVDVVELADGAGLLRDLPAGAQVVALEPGGEGWTTARFAEFLESRMTGGTRAVVFLVGGADGLPGTAVTGAQRRLSLSPLTLPHRLARVILCEQIYRCLATIRGEPYAR